MNKPVIRQISTCPPLYSGVGQGVGMRNVSAPVRKYHFLFLTVGSQFPVAPSSGSASRPVGVFRTVSKSLCLPPPVPGTSYPRRLTTPLLVTVLTTSSSFNASPYFWSQEHFSGMPFLFPKFQSLTETLDSTTDLRTLSLFMWPNTVSLNVHPKLMTPLLGIHLKKFWHRFMC